MTNNATKILENDFRQFQLLNNKQHDTWKDFISNVARMDTDDRLKEVAATSYIEGQSRKISGEMSKMLEKTYEKSYDMNYDFYVDKLGLNPKKSAGTNGILDSEQLFKSLASYESKLSREVNEMFREYGRGQISAETLRSQLKSAISQNESSLNSLFQNEARHFSEASAIDSMNDVGVEQYVFVAVMDGKTSETCGELNGKIFSTKDAEIGVNAPPMHPNCRSVIVPFDEVDYTKSKDEMSYDDWLSDYCREYFDVDYIANSVSDDRSFKELSNLELYNAYLKETEALARIKAQYDAQGLKYDEWMKLPGAAASEIEARGIYIPAGKGNSGTVDLLADELQRVININNEIERLRKKGHSEEELDIWREIKLRDLQPNGNTVVGGTLALDGKFYSLGNKSNDDAFMDIVSIATAISSLLTAWKTGNINLTPKEMETIQKAEDAVKDIFKGEPEPDGKIPWDSWQNYEKVTVNGQEYAKVGDRLYSHHAVDRMQPSGNRFGPNIYQAGGDYGRSVAPQYVEDVISSVQPVFQPETGNFVYTSGTLKVILNPSGAVITIITYQ